MKLRSFHLAVVVIGVFVVGIGATMLFNLWRTEGEKVPAKYASGEFAGEANPADIRGSYSMSDIAAAFDVTLDDLARAFGFSDAEDPGAVECKDLEEMYGEVEGGEIGTDSVRYFVALYTGLPYEPEEDSMLPQPALGVLRGRVSDEVLEQLRPRSVSLAGIRPEGAESEAADTGTAEHSEEDRTIKGKTTFGELLGWGVTKEEIEEALGGSMGKTGVTVRDHCAAEGVEFSTVKTRLQQIVDSK